MNLKAEIKKRLKRPADSHKGNYGKIFILAGSRGMTGACILTAQAALRSGAGLVTIGVAKGLVPIIAKKVIEAISKPLSETSQGTLSFRSFAAIQKIFKTQDVLAIGPGLSQNPQTQKLIRHVVLTSSIPMVIDADGLNAFKGKAELLRKIKSPAVITPHTGEFVRLFGGQAPKTNEDRLKRAKEVAKHFAVVVVLKGWQTVVAAPDGRTYINHTGNPGMATGGAGDVLTGVIAALIGQTNDLFFSVAAGSYLHGLAGDVSAKKKGKVSLIAGDIVDFLPHAFKSLIP